MGTLNRIAFVGLIAAGAVAVETPASAQNGATAAGKSYPTKYVRVITGGAGNMADIVTRQIGQRLTERWGQSVVVDNRGGAGGTIATGLAARAMADGYTLLMSDRTAIAVAPSAYKDLPYDPARDLAPIALAARAPLVIVVHPSVPATKLREFLDYAKQRPGALNYAGSGPATVTHIAGEVLKQMAGIEMTLVQYKGTPAAMLALVSGEVKVGFGMVPIALPHIAAGKLRAYVITSNRRFSGLPDVPTSAEAGLPGFESDYWIGMLAPARTPGQIIAKLNHEIVSILKTPELQASLHAQGAEFAAGTPEEFAAFIKSETVRLRKVIELARIRAE